MERRSGDDMGGEVKQKSPSARNHCSPPVTLTMNSLGLMQKNKEDDQKIIGHPLYVGKTRLELATPRPPDACATNCATSRKWDGKGNQFLWKNEFLFLNFVCQLSNMSADWKDCVDRQEIYTSRLERLCRQAGNNMQACRKSYTGRLDRLCRQAGKIMQADWKDYTDSPEKMVSTARKSYTG